MNRQGTEGRRTHNGELYEELVRELRHLRGLVREAGENFILRREGEIETVISGLSDLPPAKLRELANGLLQEMHTLKVKPGKGRLKDLKGFDRLIDALAERVATAQDRGKKPGKKRQTADAD